MTSPSPARDPHGMPAREIAVSCFCLHSEMDYVLPADPEAPSRSHGNQRGVLLSSAASSYVCPVDDAAEPFVIGVVIAPDDVPADHAGLFGVAGVVSAVQREVPQGRELGFYAV